MGIKKKIEAGGRVPADGQANTNLAANHNEQGFFFRKSVDISQNEILHLKVF